jgi:hypothetical protein
MSTEESDTKFLNDAFVFSELFTIISRDLLQAVCKGLEQIHHGNTRERPEHCHKKSDGWAGRLSAHFLSAQLEVQKCGKLVRFGSTYGRLNLKRDCDQALFNVF